MKRKSELWRAFACLVAGVLCMLAFTIAPEGYVGVSDPPLRMFSPVWCLYALLLGALLWWALVRKALRPSPGMMAFGLLFGAVNYFSTTLFAYDSWAFLNGPTAWLRAALCMLGQALPMTAGFALVCRWLERSGEAPALSGSPAFFHRLAGRLHGLAERFPRLAGLYRRHPALTCGLFLLLCWSPYLLVFYPGTIIWDMGEMVAQFFGQREMTTWHPVFTTWVLGACVWLGRLAGSDNLGAFLFTLLQTVLLAGALGASAAMLRRMGLNRRWQLSAMAFFGLTPIFGSFAQAVGKDTLYAALLLLFALETIETLRFGKPRRLWAYGLTALLTCLVRSNGLYVVLPTALLTVIFTRGKRLRLGAVLAGAVAAALLFANGLIPALGIKDETASGLYSVCFQQSARVLRDHPDTVTAEEYAEIDRVLEADRLPELYEANISDPVKFTFRQYGSGRATETEALTRYRQTWLAMLGKYPLTYLEAFVAGNSGYYAFTPKIDPARTYNAQGGIRFVFETYELGEDARYLHTEPIGALEGARRLLAAYSRGWRRVPGLSWVMYCAGYTWLLVAAGLSMARQKRWRELIGFVPALLSLGVCMLSPVNDYFRYFLPIAAMTPILLGDSVRLKNGK